MTLMHSGGPAFTFGLRLEHRVIESSAEWAQYGKYLHGCTLVSLRAFVWRAHRGAAALY